jgi:ceramide glucosyltransferase
MTPAILLSAGLSAVAVLSHVISVAAVVARIRWRGAGRADQSADCAGVTILRPLCGLENFIEETLRSSFVLDYPRYEILFCVADANDPVIPLIDRLIREHPHVDARILIGNSNLNGNPKLNNLVKGWHARRYGWVLMADSNVLMPRDQLQRMQAAWLADTGLVCSPPAGSAPQNIWAELECAFLNTHEARWQGFADFIGLGFAQGKAMLWRSDLLDDAGGIEALADELAEDAAATKIVRARGLRVRLVALPFPQPLGRRELADVWRRQLRWARLRRDTFKWFFVPEILTGVVPPLMFAALAAHLAGWPVLATIAPLAAGWYAIEALLAHVAGWPFSLRLALLCLLRDGILPALWIAAWVGDDFEWRGNAMTVAVSSTD